MGSAERVRSYKTKHFRFHAWISKEHKKELDSVLASRGQTASEWLRAMIDRCSAERLPESQGKVKKIIPREAAELAREALEEKGRFYLELARKETDRNERRKLRQKAAPYLDSAAWFADVVNEARRREYILASDQRKPRQRRKSPSSPAEMSRSATNDAPTG